MATTLKPKASNPSKCSQLVVQIRSELNSGFTTFFVRVGTIAALGRIRASTLCVQNINIIINCCDSCDTSTKRPFFVGCVGVVRFHKLFYSSKETLHGNVRGDWRSGAVALGPSRRVGGILGSGRLA